MEEQQRTEIDLKELFFVLWDKVILIGAVTVIAAVICRPLHLFFDYPHLCVDQQRICDEQTERREYDYIF